MRKLSSIVMAVVLALLPLAGTPVMAQGQNPPSNQSFVGGMFVAKNYNYTGVRINGGGGAANTTYSIQVSAGSIRLADGRTIVPFSAGGINIQGQPGTFPAIPISVGAGTVEETVTPTSVSGCYIGAPQNSCTITAAFTKAHGYGEVVSSGSVGIQEAVNDAAYWGGGLVTVDKSEDINYGGAAVVSAAIVAALPMPTVSVMDTRGMAPTFWNPMGGATVLATPATLTAVTALPSATPVGAFGTGTYHMCIAYVDAMGQEGTCSADFSQAGLATGSFIFSAPAASTGAVGYTIYIGLTGGGVTNLDYKVPLVTQPSAVGAYPVANGVCILTTVETVTPACAVTNTSYGQVGATATVSVITLSTSPINPQTTVVSTTSIYVPNPGGRTTMIYAPGAHLGTLGTITSSLAFPITTAAATIVPDVAGTINLAPGLMNFLGKTLEVCGEMTSTASAATIVDVQFQWDSMGQNTAGKGVLIGDLTATATLATTGHITFCQDFQTTVVSASATGGSINHVGGFVGVAGVTVAAAAGGSDVVTPGAIGSLNLAVDSRINVIYLHTTATDGAGWVLQNLTAKLI